MTKAKEYLLNKWLVPFHETGNPFYAWRAYFNARRLGLTIPEEILKYFDGVAHEITKIADAPPTAINRPVALAKALGMQKNTPGQGSVFTDYSNRDRRRIALDTHKAIVEEWGENKKDYAYEQIAESCQEKKGTIRNIYLQYLEVWEAKATEMIKSGKVGKCGPDGKRHFDLPFAGTADDLSEAIIVLSILQSHFKELP